MKKRQKINVRRDAEWTYNALSIDDVSLEDAPSPGAFALWDWARTDDRTRQEFFKAFVPKLLPKKRQLDADELSGKDSDQHLIDLYTRLLNRAATPEAPNGVRRTGT
jgi:hypothetical protein